MTWTDKRYHTSSYVRGKAKPKRGSGVRYRPPVEDGEDVDSVKARQDNMNVVLEKLGLPLLDVDGVQGRSTNGVKATLASMLGVTNPEEFDAKLKGFVEKIKSGEADAVFTSAENQDGLSGLRQSIRELAQQREGKGFQADTMDRMTEQPAAAQPAVDDKGRPVQPDTGDKDRGTQPVVEEVPTDLGAAQPDIEGSGRRQGILGSAQPEVEGPFKKEAGLLGPAQPQVETGQKTRRPVFI